MINLGISLKYVNIIMHFDSSLSAHKNRRICICLLLSVFAHSLLNLLIKFIRPSLWVYSHLLKVKKTSRPMTCPVYKKLVLKFHCYLRRAMSLAVSCWRLFAQTNSVLLLFELLTLLFFSFATSPRLSCPWYTIVLHLHCDPFSHLFLLLCFETFDPLFLSPT